MILGFADLEVDALETAGFGRRSSAFAKNGTYSMEFNGDLNLSTWHNCVSRVANNLDPFAEYPGWSWWALGGWLYVDARPATGTNSMMMSETTSGPFPNWAVAMSLSGASGYKLYLWHNKVQKGISSTEFSVGTWYWVCWVMNRHGQVELWVDGTKEIDVTSGANAMLDNPLPSYHEVEKDGKTSVGSSWFWDTMFLQDDYGFENADTPLTLNSAGLRVPVLTEGSDKGGCDIGTRDWTDITLSSEFLRAVALKEDGPATGFQFLACDGTTKWNYGYDNGKEGPSIIEGAILGRRPDGARWTEANFNELAWGFTLNGVYPLIATVEEGPMDTSPPTRYAGLHPG